MDASGPRHPRPAQTAIVYGNKLTDFFSRPERWRTLLPLSQSIWYIKEIVWMRADAVLCGSRLGHRSAPGQMFCPTTVSQTLWCKRVSKESRVKKEEAEREPREGFQKDQFGIKELKHSGSRAGNPSRKSVKNFQQQQPATPLFLTFLCNTDITHLSPTPQPTTFSFKWMKKDPIQKRGAEGHQRWWIQREPNCTNSYDFLVKLAAPKRKSHDGGYNNI